MAADHLVDEKNHGQSGGGDQWNRTPGIHDGCETYQLCSKSETGDKMRWSSSWITYNDESEGINQCLREKGPPRESR